VILTLEEVQKGMEEMPCIW